MSTALRKEIYNIIDSIPDQSLSTLKPLLIDFVDDYCDDCEPVIEPASPEEIAMAEERIKEYERDPSCFIPFDRTKYMKS